MIRQAANSQWEEIIVFAFSQVVAVDNGGKSLCNTWSLSLIMAENNFLSAERHICEGW